MIKEMRRKLEQEILDHEMRVDVLGQQKRARIMDDKEEIKLSKSY